MPRAELKILGGFELTDRNGTTIAVTSRKGRALLAYLALNADRRHDRAELSALLWSGRGEAQARGSLNQCLLALRKATGDSTGEMLESDRDSVTLHGEALEVDVARLRALAASDESEDLAAAAALYEGELLAGAAPLQGPYEDWLRAERESLRKIAAETSSKLAEAGLASGDAVAAVAPAEKLVALEPLNEQGHRLLMRAYGEAGRPSAALEQYQVCRELLRKEFGVEPEAETEALLEAIKSRGDGDARSDKKARPAPEARPERDQGDPDERPATEGKPSIAVLAFENMSGDPEQEYFSDGIAEDIITALSRFHQFFVIARNSSFTYKGGAIEVKRIARDMGVQYVLEGSVRRAGNRVRVTAQLIDAASDHHIWAERYDRELNDIFAVQDDITERIAMAVGPELDAIEMARAKRKSLPELGVWELIARANWHGWKFTEKDTGRAQELLSKALELDPNSAAAHVWLSSHYSIDAFYGWRRPQSESYAMSLKMAQKAVDLDKDDESTHAHLGISLLVVGRHEEAIQRFRTAIKLNPNYSYALGSFGMALIYAHRHDEGLELLHKAMRLSPKDLMLPFYLFQIGLHHFIEERYDEARVWAEKALHENPNFPSGMRLLTSAHGMLDNHAEAGAAYKRLVQLLPGVTVAASLAAAPFAFDADAERYGEGLRRAGMPEK